MSVGMMAAEAGDDASPSSPPSSPVIRAGDRAVNSDNDRDDEPGGRGKDEAVRLAQATGDTRVQEEADIGRKVWGSGHGPYQV